MVVYSQAKINIGLHVLRKKENGYHEIESIFYPLQWEDVIEGIPYSGNDADVIPIFSSFQIPKEHNLVYRAWQLMHKTFGIPSVQFYLWKRIPMEAGLGGGSGNAAATLIMLNNMFKLNLSITDVEKLALQLGSDVPFFLHNRPSLVLGQGEIIKPIPLDLSAYAIQVVVPRTLGAQRGISTREAYALIKPRIPSFRVEEILSLPVREWRYYIQNDFETVIFPRFPILQQIKSRLYEEGALFASMSGTGSAVYGIFQKENPHPSWDMQKYLIYQKT